MTITAKIIADSISPAGDRITTYELEYPRFIHSEFMTHRQFSRNAASSRAIKTEVLLEMVRKDPAMPEEWGADKPGMQAGENFEGYMKATAEWIWRQSAKVAVVSAENLHKFGLHKQIVNRVLEPFVHMKTVVTATEYDNFFWLRCHSDAQPEIRILAEKMYKLYKENKPTQLNVGDWHLPYFGEGYFNGQVDYHWVVDEGATLISGEYESIKFTLAEAKRVSASCCAQVSFRLLNNTLDKADNIYKKLVGNAPVHASPFEHQATPIEYSSYIKGEGGSWPDQEGITHSDRGSRLWSGNFNGWIQHRQLINNHDCNSYIGDKDES